MLSIKCKYLMPVQRKAFLNLLQLYQYEFSAMLKRDVNKEGRYGFVTVPGAWRGGRGSLPFLIYMRGKLAGFAFIRGHRLVNGRQGYEVKEFFVLRKYRRTGVGKQAAISILRRYPGWWQAKELVVNTPGIAFWRSVIKSVARGPVSRSTIDDMKCQVFSVR